MGNQKKLKNNNVVLIGMMSSGKSTIGWCLSRYAGLGFIDTDTIIERQEKRKVATIFEEKGEEHFRDLEKNAVASLEGVRNHVISVGGGALLTPENSTIKDLGTSIWLNPPILEIARRLIANVGELEQRPLFKEIMGLDDHERLEALQGQRIEDYRSCDIEFEDTYSTPEASAKVLLDRLILLDLFDQKSQKQIDKWRSL